MEVNKNSNTTTPDIPPTVFTFGNTPTMIGINERTIIAPDGGWKPDAWYVVEIAFNKNNPIHKALFFSGFLNGKYKGLNNWPGGYNRLFNPTYDDSFEIHQVFYMKVLNEIPKEILDLGL